MEETSLDDFLPADGEAEPSTGAARDDTTEEPGGEAGTEKSEAEPGEREPGGEDGKEKPGPEGVEEEPGAEARDGRPGERAAGEDREAVAPAADAASGGVDAGIATTYRYDPAGAACEACGETAPRRWRDDQRLVCLSCKGW